MNALHRPVHVTKFSPTNSTQLMSCSDDTTVRLWDIPTETALNTFTGHTDYVRSGSFSTDNPNVLYSGSYDATIRVWDARVSEGGGQVMRMKHGSSPVTDVVPFPQGTMLVTSGGPIIRMWDMLTAGRCVRAFSNHQKTVTCLAFDKEGKRMLSGGLDQLVKAYEVGTFKVTHTMRYPAQVLCMALSVR